MSRSILLLALVERQERLEDAQKRTNDGHHLDDGPEVAIYELVRFGPYPPACLVILSSHHDVGETAAGVWEELDDPLEEGEHLRVGAVTVQDAF